jgi:hypothetical protein
MRSGIFFLAVILIGCKGEPPSSASGIFRERCDLEAYCRLRQQQFHVIEPHTARTKNGMFSTIQYLRKNQTYLVVIDQDTFTNNKWRKSSWRMGFHDTIPEPLMHPIRIWQENEIGQLVKQDRDGQSENHFLLNYSLGEDQFITLAALTNIQLDNDIQQERIVAFEQGWYHRYYIFDDELSGWKFHGRMEIPNKSWLPPVDTMLPGFFGLASGWGGTGLCASHYEYFRLTPDSFAFCFSISTEYDQFLWWTAGQEYNASMLSNGKGCMINDSTVEVHYTTSFQLTDTAEWDDTTILFRHDQVVNFRFHKSQPDSAWIPDPGHAGFYEGRYFFYPEIEMMFELYDLKESGTKNQKYFLRGLEVDPDPFFR